MPIFRTLEFNLWIQCVSRHNSAYLSHTSYWCRSMILKWHDSVDWVLHNHRFNGNHIHSHSLRLTRTHMQTRVDRLARWYIESRKQFWKACHARYKREDFDAKHDTHTHNTMSAHPHIRVLQLACFSALRWTTTTTGSASIRLLQTARTSHPSIKE